MKHGRSLLGGFISLRRVKSESVAEDVPIFLPVLGFRGAEARYYFAFFIFPDLGLIDAGFGYLMISAFQGE